MSRATGRLKDTARIAFPIFVRCTMNSRPNIKMTANTMIIRLWLVI